MKRRIIVDQCDGCGRIEAQTRRCRFGVEGRTPLRQVDLCADCRRPLEELEQRVAQYRPSRLRITDMQVMDPADIERLAASTRRAGSP